MNHCRTPQSIPSLNRCLQILVGTALLGGFWQTPPPAIAQTQLQCLAYNETGPTLHNQGSFTYENSVNTVNPTRMTGFSNSLASTIIRSGVLEVESQGIKDGNGNLVFGLGMVADALNGELVKLGLSQEDAAKASLAGIEAFAALPSDTPMQKAIATVNQALSTALGDQATLISQTSSLNQSLPLILTGLSQPTLTALGLTPIEATIASQAALGVITVTSAKSPWRDTAQKVTQAAIDAVPSQTNILTQARTGLNQEVENLQAGIQPSVQSGSVLYYQFLLSNTGTAPLTFQLPDASGIQQTGFTGPGTVTGITYEAIATQGESRGITPRAIANSSQVQIQPGDQVKLRVAVQLNTLPQTATAMTVSFGSGCSNTTAQQTLAILPAVKQSLIDPLGQITGCAGEILADYRGFTVGLYEPDPNDPTGEVKGIIPLTTTELPDNPNNTIPAGVKPNTQNSNPFYLTNSDQGRYSFLLDENRGQLDQGRTYILLVNPPPDSIYGQRRIRIVIGDSNGRVVNYTATSLDGRSLTATNNQTVVNGTIQIEDAEQVGLVLAVLNFKSSICEAKEIQITKTGDRAAAEPGDTVIYRLTIRNLSQTNIGNSAVTDTLPFGFQFLPESVRGELPGQAVTIDTHADDRTVTFRTTTPIPPTQVLTIAYAAQLTPDAIRGSGENSVIVNAQRTDNNFTVKDGPAIHRLKIRPGIIADCGTLIGRVFVDKNFDGEQQPGEPGVPNAVIFLEDGNRITTDANGLFSVANVLPGNHTGTLDLTSIPGYTLAPNLYVSERNSRSRLVRLEPGGMARMNFAVTPTFQEENQP